MSSFVRAALLITVFFFAAAPKAHAIPILLTFDGIGADVNLRQFYNGGLGANGPGPNWGIEFLSGRIGNPCFQSLFSPLSCLPDPPAFEPFGEQTCPFITVTCSTLNMASGFTTGIHFQYIAPVAGMAIALYSDVNAGGTLLALMSLPATVDSISNLTPNGYFDVGIPFTGTARSVQFVQNDIPQHGAIDNVVLGSVDAVPEPATLGLFAGGLAMLVLRRWRRGPSV